MGIVGYELEDESTGVGRALAGLLAGAAAEAPSSWRFVVFLRRPLQHPVLASERIEAAVQEGGSRFSRPVLWEQIELPREIVRQRVELVFSPSYSLPPRTGLPGVVTVHDLSFERLPQEFGWRERWRRRILARRACRIARRVLVDARVIAAEIRERYGVSAGRLGVVPLAVEESFRPAGDEASRREDQEQLRELGIEPPFLLHVGSLLERRRPAALLAALRAAQSIDPSQRLVLAGPNRLRRPEDLDRLLENEDLAGSVVRTGWVSDRALVALYRAATATLSLSSYEGFCLPPLESLACGTPAVVDSAPGLADLWPEYPFRVGADSHQELARVVRRAIEVRSTGEWSPVAAIERVRRTSWRSAARSWMGELERACA
ncbi:MAG TPA: glycosyltransferase [Thermoanaerobaculia bacterium]|nr:glycosyltransferase [Thermoanaerobaculia bacterium]